jgi:hypothetical protein
MPEEIEHANRAIRPRRTDLLRRGQLAPQRIGGHPGVSERVSQLRAGCGQCKSEREAEPGRGEAAREQGFQTHVWNILDGRTRQATFLIKCAAPNLAAAGVRG